MSDGLDQVRRDWETLGAADPLWAVLMKPGTRHGGWDPDEFLATGRAEVDAAHQPPPRPRPHDQLTRVLDFGCGAGRLTQALATPRDRVIGLDVSTPMLDVARRLDRSDGRCEFVLNTARRPVDFDDGQFDLVYSSLVLQHLPPAAARAFLAEFARVVRPGGAIVVQVAASRLATSRACCFGMPRATCCASASAELLRYPAPMRMEGMTARRLRRRRRAGRVEVLDVVEDTTYGGHWTYHRYFADARASAT